MQRWLDGERASLWASRPQLPRSSARKLTTEQRQDFAINLAREGFDKKACTALLSQGLCDTSPATVAALQALHPTSAPPAVLPLDDLSVAPLLDLENVAQALQSFPADIAPGPSGLRVQHLRDALQNGGGAGLLDQLTLVVNLLAQGRACASVAPLLAGAGLVALPKPSVAVGELLRRLTAKCLMHAVRTEARSYLWPAQAGVAVKGGAEAAIHALCAWVGRHAGSHDSVVVKIDFQNAFNTISREAVLGEAREHFPALARWVTWCYQSPSNLQFGDAILQSSNGVQQGDPLGPLLFSAGIQPLAAGLKQGSVDFSIFYLDDGVLAGSLADVSDALTKLQQAAAALGLAVNLSKSEAIAVGMTSPADVATKLPPALVHSADGSSRILTDFEFLGAAIGRPAHLQAHAAARVAGAQQLLEAVGALPDPQVALRLLRASAGYARLVHTMRCCPPAGHAAALQAFDELVQESFSALSGLHLEPEQWQQAARGFAQAGLGLRSTQAHAPAAYLASVGSSSQHCQELDAGYWVGHSGDVAAALSELNAHLSPACHLTSAGALALSQRELSQRIDAASWGSQLDTATPVDKATLLSEATPGARAFLTCVPSGRTKMEPAVFNAELRARLRVPESGADTWCPKCDAILDTYGHHAGMCMAGGGRVLRHNALRDLVFSWCERGCLRPEREKVGLLLPQRPDDVRSARRRPADVFLPAFLGRPTAIDFAITAPQRLDVLGSQGGASAASVYTDHKKRHLDTAAACAAQHVEFLPLVAETTGAWAPEAAKALDHISRAAGASHGSTLLQEACVLIRTWRARAALRRRAELETS